MKKVGGIFLLVLTLPTFWATHILKIFIVEFAWIPIFQISKFQMSRFPDFRSVRIPNFKIPIFPNTAGGARQTLRSNRTPSNAPRGSNTSQGAPAATLRRQARREILLNTPDAADTPVSETTCCAMDPSVSFSSAS